MNAPETSQSLTFLRTLARRWPLILLLALLTAAAALAVSLSGTKQYDASALVLLRGQDPVDAITQPNVTGGSNDPERDLNTKVELIKVESTAQAVQRRLDLERSTDELLEQLSTETSSTSNIVTLTVRDPDPVVAANIANAFGDAYIIDRLRSASARYEQAALLASNRYRELTPEARAAPPGVELASRAQRLRDGAQTQTSDAQVVRRATAPVSPSRPRPLLSAILGLVLGLLLGVAVVFALDLFDRRLRDEETVEELFQLPILASLPRPKTSKRTAGDPASREAYGLLAASLRYSSLRGSSNVLMVTSAGEGEGKTSVTLGLAGALTNLGLRVIVIEADLRRPTFAKYASLGPSAGVTGVLGRPEELGDELVWIDRISLATVDADHHAAFAVLPSGPLSTNPLRTLSDPAFANLVAAARATADVVLIDTPPIGTVNDPAAVAQVCDTVAFVVRLNRTTKDDSKRALRVLGGLDVRLAGLIITDAPATAAYGSYEPYDDPGSPAPVERPELAVGSRRR